MHASLIVSMDNAAFGNDDGEAPATQELARILRDLAHKLEVNGVCEDLTARDSNGNGVGSLKFTDYPVAAVQSCHEHPRPKSWCKVRRP